jgi:hypothetical protein
MFDSASELGEKALVELGYSKYEAYRSTRTFKHHEESVIQELYEHWQEDHGQYIQETRRFSEQVSETLQSEKNYSIHDADCAWDVDSLKDEVVSKLNKENIGSKN